MNVVGTQCHSQSLKTFSKNEYLKPVTSGGKKPKLYFHFSIGMLSNQRFPSNQRNLILKAGWRPEENLNFQEHPPEK